MLLSNFLDALLYSVQTTGVHGVHLLGGDLLLGHRLVHKVLQIRDALDERLRSNRSDLQLLSLADELVELCKREK